MTGIELADWFASKGVPPQPQPIAADMSIDELMAYFADMARRWGRAALDKAS